MSQTTSKMSLSTPARNTGASVGHARPRDGYFIRTLRRYLSNRKWLFMYVFGRFAPVRWTAVKITALLRRGQKTAAQAAVGRSLAPVFSNLRADEVVEALRRDGFYSPLSLPGDVVRSILAFAETHQCHPDRDTSVRFAYRDHNAIERRLGRNVLLARYSNTARDCEAISRLQDDPLLREVASRYIGAPARHIGNRLWWSFAKPDASEIERVRSGQGYHWDLDDYRTVTFFFYLTDVDAAAGPHTLVKGSHRRKPLRWLLSVFKSRNERDVLDRYGANNVVTICGPAGTGFAEDLMCFHKGNAPKHRDRLLLQIRFGLIDYGTANDIVSNDPAPQPAVSRHAA